MDVACSLSVPIKKVGREDMIEFTMISLPSCKSKFEVTRILFSVMEENLLLMAFADQEASPDR
jgi:hypothetical protein